MLKIKENIGQLWLFYISFRC